MSRKKQKTSTTITCPSCGYHAQMNAETGGPSYQQNVNAWRMCLMLGFFPVFAKRLKLTQAETRLLFLLHATGEYMNAERMAVFFGHTGYNNVNNWLKPLIEKGYVQASTGKQKFRHYIITVSGTKAVNRWRRLFAEWMEENKWLIQGFGIPDDKSLPLVVSKNNKRREEMRRK